MKKKIIAISPEEQKKKAKIVPIEKIKVAAYCRVSSETDEQLNSLSVQRKYFDELFAAHSDWTNAGIYYDEGISGLGMKRRAGFNKMVDDALAGKIDLIIVKSISRFARNTVDALKTIRDLKAKGIRIIFEKENIDTSDTKSEFILTIMSSLAQQESQSISENVKWGIRKSYVEGKVKIPGFFYGYKYCGKYSFQVDKEEAKIVCLIYKMFLERKARNQIGAYLDKNNVPTATGLENAKWSRNVVNSILTNEKYCGDAILQKKYVQDYITKKQVMNDGKLTKYYVKNNHEAIIPRATWELTQEILKSKRYENRQNNLFSLMIKCSNCGGWYQCKTQTRDYFVKTFKFYQCENKLTKTKECKNSCDITQDQLELLFHNATLELYDAFPELVDDLCSITEKIIDGKRKQNRLKKLFKEKPNFKISEYERTSWPVLVDYAEITQNTLTFHFLNKGLITESYIRWKPIEHFERKPKSPPKQ